MDSAWAAVRDIDARVRVCGLDTPSLVDGVEGPPTCGLEFAPNVPAA